MLPKKIIYTIAIAMSVLSCVEKPSATFLGQGMMAGEVGETSVILQTRLTSSDTLMVGDLPGANGWARFEVSKSNVSSEPSMITDWLEADVYKDYIIKSFVEGLLPNQSYTYQVRYGRDTLTTTVSPAGAFKTLAGNTVSAERSMVVVTGMNYYHFHYGNYDSTLQYMGVDKHLGYPALETILELQPDYFVGTGDNVYFDHPAWKSIVRAQERGRPVLMGLFDGHEVKDEQGMRKKYHVQFVQPRFKDLFRSVGTYWEKDDHDYRINDSDPYIDFPITHEQGIQNFREQLPVVDPNDAEAVTYRTHRMTKDLQVWFLEGRDYRSANGDPDGPAKTIWGSEQKAWLQATLQASDARYKLIISPTPLVGPDGGKKRDSHVNLDGFRHEGDAFFQWLVDHQFSSDSLFIVCGDRHWQYHAIHPSGFHELSCGALVDANSRAGVLAGDPNSTDPTGEIQQLYVQGKPQEASGGFLKIDLQFLEQVPSLKFSFFDERGKLHYAVVK
ncbi:MAG: alkaline phosphatase [Saprospiraceae bacterium]|nr:alkaline phosphatase [Saprospiraceae bacterium]